MKPKHMIVFSSLLIFGAAPGYAAVLTATAKTIVAVFAKAKAGDTIKLSGTFGRTTLSGRTFKTALRIDATRAVFTDTLLIKDVSGLYVSGGKYGSSTGTTAYNKGIAVYDGNNVTINKANVVGSRTGQGIGFVRTTNATVSNSAFDSLKSGVGFTSVTGGKLVNNKSTRSSSDGFDVADSHNVMITGNNCSATAPAPGAHPDCVQLWSLKGNAPQSDITVTGNTATGATQGFTSFDEEAGGGLRINISNNRVNTSYPQGIACYGCIDSVFTKNVVTTIAGSKYKTNINIIRGNNNVIASNSIGNKTNATSNTALAARSPVPQESSQFTTYSEKQQTVDFASDSFDHTSTASKSPDGDATGSAFVAGVPEPSAWLLMIAGFGFIGGAMRRRTRIHAVNA